MIPLFHFIISIIIGLVLYAVGFLGSYLFLAIFILWSIIIDIDHIFYFFIKYYGHSIKEIIQIMIEYRKAMTPGFYIFHSPEFNLVLFGLTFYKKIFLILLIASLVHVGIDIIEHYVYHGNFNFIKEWSIIHQLFFK